MAEQKFTPRAENVLRLAQETALELGHGYVGCEHILLGLLREDGGAACRALGEAGVTEEQLREQLVRTVGHGLDPAPALTGADAPRTQRGGDGGRRGDALRESAHRHGAPAAGPAARRRQHGGAAARGGGGRPEAPLRRGGAADQRNAAHGGKGRESRMLRKTRAGKRGRGLAGLWPAT